MRFECQPGCTNCCRQQGFVHLTDGDVNRIAPFLGMSVRAFRRRYVYRTTNRQRLRVPRGSTCHFLTDQGCSIHAVKPAQCRLFPYWPEFLDDRAELRKIAEWCPGIGKGELIQIGAARQIAQEMRDVYPKLYPSQLT
jgi:Fe-S-cluster containining protein